MVVFEVVEPSDPTEAKAPIAPEQPVTPYDVIMARFDVIEKREAQLAEAIVNLSERLVVPQSQSSSSIGGLNIADIANQFLAELRGGTPVVNPIEARVSNLLARGYERWLGLQEREFAKKLGLDEGGHTVLEH